MTGSDLRTLISGGENAEVEFKRDDVAPRDLTRELVAFANFDGGYVLLGVEDDGSISGLTRGLREIEEWVMNVCRDLVRPRLIPFFQVISDVEEGKHVAVVRVERGWTVHHRYYRSRPNYFIRVGSETRDMSQEEHGRLFQQRGLFRVELRPVPKSGLEDLDFGRLSDYFGRVREQEVPSLDDAVGWRRLLINTEIMTDEDGGCGTVAGILLFGKDPNRFLPQAGNTAAVYPGAEKERVEPTTLRGPLVSLFRRSRDG